MTAIHNPISRSILVGRSTGDPATGFAEPTPPATEPTTAKPAPAASTCSTCEAMLPALVRIEAVLQSLLTDVAELKAKAANHD